MLHAKAQLQDFTGTLLIDGYAAYTKTVEQINLQEQQIVHAACWVHMRRGFEKALDSEPQAAQQGQDIIAGLYRHEKHIRYKQLDLADIHAYRQQHTEPLVTDFFRWIYQQRQRTDLLPKSSFAKVLHYAHERESQLYPWIPIILSGHCGYRLAGKSAGLTGYHPAHLAAARTSSLPWLC